MKPKIKIKDAAFIPFGGKSCSMLGERAGEAPINFEWDNSDPDPNDVCFFTDTYISRSNDYKCKVKIALPLESPPLRQRMYDYLATHSKDFDIIFTFCQDYLGGNWLYRPHLGSMIKPEHMRLYPKTKLCSMVVSDKYAIPNHVFRHAVSRIAYDYDVELLGTGVMKPTVNKLDALRNYSYSVVVEASSEKGCISEQLYDCLSVGTVPIYFGPRFTSLDRPVSDWWVLRFWNIDDIHNILGGMVNIVQPTHSIAVDAFDYSKSLPCVEDWLWEKFPLLFGAE